MDKRKLIFKSEDETDFMPIIPINEQEGDLDNNLVIPDELPILPLRNTVLFPGVVLPITVGRDKSIKAVSDVYKTDKLIGVIAQKDANIEEPEPKDLCKIGTVAKIVKLIKMPDGGTTIIIQGKKRFEWLEMLSDDPYFKASIQLFTEADAPDTEDFKAYVSTIKDLAAQIIQLSPNLPTEASIILKNIENPAFLINFVSSNLNSDLLEKQQLLEINDVNERAIKLVHILQRELQFAELKDKVTNKTRTELDKQQRDYFLQQQLKSIKEELGGDTNEREIAETKKKAETKKWPEAAKNAFKTGIQKLERMHASTPDYSVVYNHLDLMLDLPWDEYTNDNYDLKNAKKVLDIDHYGMTKIKSRILEYLAVLKLKGDMKSPILCFLGPPGIGKTSLGKSIAHAIGRKYVRLSLGGLHVESEIRGHRKTYIGAMPGRILQNIRPALRDRLEIIDLSGYAIEEKVEIAKRHLVPKQKEAHGLAKVNFKINDKVLEKVIEQYTRESGVRELDRQLASIMRFQAKEMALKAKVKLNLTAADVEKILGQQRYSNEIYKTANMAGE